MQPRATWHDVLDTKLDLYRWYGSDFGKNWVRHAVREADRDLPSRVMGLTRQLWSTEISNRLPHATPFFVSSEMCRLVEVASETFKPEPIYPTDFLAAHGFLLYERPFTIPDRYDEPVQIAGFSWQPMMDASDPEPPDRPLTRDDEVKEWLEERHRQGRVDGLALTLYQPAKRDDLPAGVTGPPIVPLHLTPWYWGMSFEGNEIDIEGERTGAEWWWKILQTTLRLMQQHISVRHFERPPRPQRREAKRYGVSDEDVVVVRLRREATPRNGDEPAGEAHYTHRFVVGGHWRNQPYKGGIIRQIYIADYIKGPEDAPLVIKPRVYNWSR